MKVEIEVKGVNELVASFEKVRDGLLDLRQLGTWDAVATEFRRIEKEIFDSEGGAGKSGKWKPLATAYAVRKQKVWGSVPILQASGKLYRSLTQKGAPDSVFETSKMEMAIGSSVEYGGYHQRGTSRIPRRPPVDLTEEHIDRLKKPIKEKLKQLVANARLKDARGF
jgi:phage gpG-like protein